MRARFLVLILICFGFAAPGQAQTASLAERLTPEVMALIYPTPVTLGAEEGEPPAVALSAGGQVVAFAFSTYDVVRAPGYSTVPFDVIAAVGTDGRVTGAVVIRHNEPYLTNFPVREALADEFLLSHRAFLVDGNNPNTLKPDFVAGATISARAMRGAIVDSARLILRARVSRPVVTEPTLDVVGYAPRSWAQLEAEGAIVTRTVTGADVQAALAEAGADAGTLEKPLVGPDEVYTELTVAFVTPARIGRNIVGVRRYDAYVKNQATDRYTLTVFSDGPYDFVGTERLRRDTGYRFHRIRLVQGDLTYIFDRDHYQRIAGLDPGMPRYDHGGLLYVPKDSGFDPLAPWQLELVVHAQAAGAPVELAFPLAYRLPEDAILMPPVEPVPAWVEAWQEETTNVIILGVALILLTGILVFQGRLTRNRLAHRWIRNGFLLFTLLWLGWTASAQLSIVNVVNYLRAPFENVGIGFYLAEPLIVMIALYTLVSLVILGRGVFCGWLCPFGALQELLAQVARAFKLPQWNPSDRLQKYLWLGKYVSAAVIIGLAFVATEAATAAEEVEPFKTAITSVFTRPWPYVAYAGVLLFFGLFTERGFCRFLCPLGGVLAALDRVHLVDMLKRKPECGSPCRLCERSCPVKAILPTGRIKMAECFQCLDCMVEYYDDHRCPPLVKARKLKDRLDPAPQPLPIAARVTA